jgi:hypothetical protein
MHPGDERTSAAEAWLPGASKSGSDAGAREISAEASQWLPDPASRLEARQRRRAEAKRRNGSAASGSRPEKPGANPEIEQIKELLADVTERLEALDSRPAPKRRASRTAGVKARARKPAARKPAARKAAAKKPAAKRSPAKRRRSGSR